MIVDYLQGSVRDELKIHIKRRMKTLTDTPSPAQFLTIELMKKNYNKNFCILNHLLLVLLNHFSLILVQLLVLLIRAPIILLLDHIMLVNHLIQNIL